MKVGFIGLGNIGRPIAENLVEPPLELSVYDSHPPACIPFEGKAAIAQSPAEIARNATCIGICVRDEKDVADVLNGPTGLLENCASGSIVIIHSTIRPATIRQLADDAAAHGIHIIDAPVSRGPQGLNAAKFVCMVGADAAIFEQAKPYFLAFTSDLIHAGSSVGAGMTLKLCNNLTTYIELSAAVEAFRLAEAGGLSRDLVREVMTSAGTLTSSMKQFVDFLAIARQDMKQYEPRLAWTLSLAEKDLDFALDLGRQFGVTLPITETARREFRAAIGLG
jgi:3-hydroxyisobutyrate dehydrogenase-like beta-hydroxyacid dehydrogenase